MFLRPLLIGPSSEGTFTSLLFRKSLRTGLSLKRASSSLNRLPEERVNIKHQDLLTLVPPHKLVRIFHLVPPGCTGPAGTKAGLSV